MSKKKEKVYEIAKGADESIAAHDIKPDKKIKEKVKRKPISKKKLAIIIPIVSVILIAAVLLSTFFIIKSTKYKYFEYDKLSFGKYMITGLIETPEEGKVEIPKGVTTIGARAFANDDCITSVTMSKSVTRIKTLAFYGCTNLKSITVPDSVETIEDSAFYGCNNLTDITIGKGVKFIGMWFVPEGSVINYRGTKAEWGNIEKGYASYYSTLIIKCTDGTING